VLNLSVSFSLADGMYSYKLQRQFVYPMEGSEHPSKISLSGELQLG